MRESTYHNAVASWLLDTFAADAIEHEPTLDSGREPDFLVRTPWGGWAIEVENSSDDAYNGLGQALVYAHETGLQPVVVFPADESVPQPTFGPVEVENV